MPDSSDVLVVGAGPVGLTLALGLTRAGVSCRIIERETQLRTRGVRGKSVTPRTMEIFDDFAVADAVLARAEVNLAARFYSGATVTHELHPGVEKANAPTLDRPYLGTALLSQHHTEFILRKRLGDYGVEVELDSELVGYVQHDDQVIASVRHSDRVESIQTHYLVGCDGGRSRVRKLASIPFLGETWETERFVMGTLHADGLDDDYMHVWSDEAYGAFAVILVPMACDGNWAFHAAVDPDEHGESAAPTLENFQRIFTERARMSNVRLRDLSWTTEWRPNVRMVQEYRRDRVFLAGDSAHVHSAAGGQGMNTGIADAHNLAWKLAAVLRGAQPTLLDTYQAERSPVARQLLVNTSMQHREMFETSGVDALSKVFVSDTGQRDLTGLGITYRGGPLAVDLDHTVGIRAGDRAPDAPCGRIRLFDIFRGPHWTLLAFGNKPACAMTNHPELRTVAIDGANPAAADVALTDDAGHAHRHYGVTGEAIVLVRPDGHVALTGRTADPEFVAGLITTAGLLL